MKFQFQFVKVKVLYNIYHHSIFNIFAKIKWLFWILTDYARNQAISDKCYKFHPEPLSWHDAYLACKLEEGRLAIINSAKEASIVVGFLGDNLNSNTPDPNILYLGFSDLMFPYQYRTIVGKDLMLLMGNGFK